MGSHKKAELVLVFLVLGSCAFLSCGLPSKYSILSFHFDKFPLQDDVLKLFKEWKEEYKKSYEAPEEEIVRFENFKRNLKYISEKNAMRDSPHRHRLGLNKFADLSNEEFKNKFLSKVKRPSSERNGLISSGSHVKGCSCEGAPHSLDWRKKGVVTPVKDQGECGSCWAFSSAGAIEGINAIVTGDLISLSEQELMDCASTNDGCEGGVIDYAFEWVIYNGGIDTQSNYPYTARDGTCNVTKEQANVVSIDGYNDLAPSDSSLLCAVAKQPVSVGLDGSSWDFQLYADGIYDGDCSSNPDDMDHAILIVGYGSEGDEDYWIAKNSWGTSWGMDGYIHIRRNTDLRYGVCAINAQASYPTKQSITQSPTSSPSLQPLPPPVKQPSPSPVPAMPPPTQPWLPPPPPTQPLLPPPPPTQPSLPPPPPPTQPSLPPLLPPTQPWSPPSLSPWLSPLPPPTPQPSECGSFSYCPPGQTCCCLVQFCEVCFVFGCCGFENAVCCDGTPYCCPGDFPICDTQAHVCLQNPGDLMGVAAKKRESARYKLPWTKFEETNQKTSHLLQLRRNAFAAVL